MPDKDFRNGQGHDPYAVPVPTMPRAVASGIAGIDLWLCALERTPAEIECLTEWLSPTERARALRFGTDALRERWIAGRAMLRMVLGNALGTAPAAVEIRRGVRGRPELGDPRSGIDFNVSHTAGVAFIGIAHGAFADTRIGVDIERIDRDVGVDRLARKFLTATERATLANLGLHERRRRFVRYWTCKEAMSKATGDGLIAPFGRLDVALSESPRLVDGPAPYVPAHWTLRHAAVPAAWVATIATWRLPGSSSAVMPQRS
jgi:4'-phosphopantetheinyl transferase